MTFPIPFKFDEIFRGLQYFDLQLFAICLLPFCQFKWYVTGNWTPFHGGFIRNIKNFFFCKKKKKTWNLLSFALLKKLICSTQLQRNISIKICTYEIFYKILQKFEICFFENLEFNVWFYIITYFFLIGKVSTILSRADNF